MALKIVNSLNLGGLLPAHVTREALEAGADLLRERAAARAPLLTGAALKKANDERRADPGELRDSAYSRVVGDLTAEVGFTAFYAAWQEENMDYDHEDGQSKYLETTLTLDKDDTLKVMAKRLGAGLGK